MKQYKHIFRATGLLIVCMITVKLFAKYATVSLIDYQEEWGCGTEDFPIPPDDLTRKGKSSFQQKCQSCHSIFKDLTGPALHTVGSNPFWTDNKKIAAYLRNPRAFLRYDYIKGLRKKFDSGHTAFPEISDEEVESVMNYVSFDANQRIY